MNKLIGTTNVATIKFAFVGDEGVPIQVDGEAWIQPPGIIRILHKNRMQMLCRNRALENSLRTWEEKQKHSTTIQGKFVHLSYIAPFLISFQLKQDTPFLTTKVGKV